MVRITNRYDPRVLDYIMGHPEIYWQHVESGALEPEKMDFASYANDVRVRIWVVFLDDYPVGFCGAVQKNESYWETHVGFLPVARGSVATAACRFVISELFEKFGARKLIAEVAEDNRPAQMLARRLGFKLEGTNPKSFWRDGKLIDQLRFGLWR